MKAVHTQDLRRQMWWRRVFVFLCTCGVLYDGSMADTSFQTRGHLKCTEPNPPFDSNTCNHFTQYAALVDLTGGGESARVIRVVGAKSTPLLNLKEYENGTLECPPGVACNQLESDDLRVSIVRSPVPAGVPRILPGGNVSIGFYWKLTRNNQYSADYRVPYAYEVANCSSSVPHSSCDGGSSAYGAASGVEFRTFDPFEDDGALDVREPSCGAECEGNGFNLRDTCGTNVPDPTGYLTDNDGKCSELCCGASTSVKVRQLKPFCYMMNAEGSPGVAVDFAVEVSSSEIGPDPIVVPVYGISDPQTTFTNVSAGVRVRIWSLVNDFGRFDDTNAFSVVHGSIVICPNHTSPGGELPGVPIFPNEVDGPVDNVSDISWFYMPSSYVPFYRDATAAEAAQIIKPSLPVQSEHPKLFGESGSVVEQAAQGFIEREYGTGGAALSQCVSLDGVLPLVPGYDTDEPLTDAAPFELPSPCYMWSQARRGNDAFLPPGSDLSSFNWFIRRSLSTDQNDDDSETVYDPDDLYLVFVPSEAQIEAIEAEAALLDGLLLSVEFNDNVASYASTVKVPITTSGDDVSPPTCALDNPSDADSGSFVGEGDLWLTVASALTDPLESGEQADPITVSLICTNDFGDSVPVFVTPSATQSAAITYDVQKRFHFNLKFTFSRTYSQFSQGQRVGDCTAQISGASRGDGDVGPIPCKTGGATKNTDNLPDCGFLDVECQHDELGKDYTQIGAVQMWIGIAAGVIIAIAVMGITVALVKRDRERGPKAAKRKVQQEMRRAREFEKKKKEDLKRAETRGERRAKAEARENIRSQSGR